MERRHQSGTVKNRIFTGLKKLIAQRKKTMAFADFDIRQVLLADNTQRTQPGIGH